MKRILPVLLSVMIAVSLCACTDNADKESVFTPSLAKDTTGVVNVVGHYDNFEALVEEFNRFKEYYPNVEMNYTKLDNYNKIIATTLIEEQPDVYFTFPWMMDSAENTVLFENAEDLADPSLKIDLSCIRKGLLHNDSLGKTSIVPIYTTTYGMMVNEKIFEKENLSIPKTYDDFIDVCTKLKAAGYDNPVMGYNKGDSSLLYSLFFPFFCGSISGNETAVRELNDLQPSSKEYVRDTLELVDDFMQKGFVNLENCNQLKDDYDAVIKRFFEGDIPMMFASGSTVSGTEKREIKSEAFVAEPFKYSFHPVPSTDKGGYFLNTISMGFSVNKNSKNLDVVNEFMRFLIHTGELNLMAQNKRMVTPCKNMKLDEIYRSFGELGEDRTIYLYDLGLADAPDVQVRRAGARVTNGTLTVDEAVAAFGTLQ